MSNTTATQILFIDSRVADSDVLLAGLDPAIEIVRLNNTESGLQQMANAVQGRSNIGSVHVISHGGPGSLLLGSGVVNQSQLAAEQLALSTLQSALSEDADLLLYGCDVAAGAEGQSFIDALAAATGADVAASTDLTGGGTAQSDWVLESSTGAVETAAIEPVGYQYDLGYWGNVGLYGDRWNVNRGSQYTIIFDADGGGKGSKYGVANNVGAYNVSNLYTSAYNGDAEAIWYTFTGSATAVPGSPWYVSNWDPDAGGYTYWGAYANSTPWQLTSSVTLTQGQSQTLFVSNLVRDDYYSSGDIWKYLVGASAGGYVSSSSLSIGNSSAKYATFYAPDVQSWKGTVYLGSITYSVNDGVNYSRGGSYNPDYFSAYSQYRSATYTTAVYGTYVDDLITWNTPPANQSWASANKNSFNFGRGAQDPDSSDYVTGYSLVSVQEYIGTTWQSPREANGSALTEKNATTGLPNWLKLSGTTLYVDNLAPENAGRTFKVFVRASSSDGRSIDRSFELSTGSADVVNNKPTSPGNAFSVNEAQPFVLGASSFSFVDLDNTVGKSVASGAVLSHIKISGLPTQGQLKIFDVVSTPLTVTDGGSFKTVTFTDTTSEMVISVGTTTVRIPAPSGANTAALDVAAAVARAVNYDKLSSYTATALTGTDAGKVNFVAKAGASLSGLTAANILSLTAPVAVTGDDSSTVGAVEGTEFNFPADKKLVYVGPSASGSDSFQYYVHDGVAYSTNSATMAVTVKEVNEPPTLTVSPGSIAVTDVAALSSTLTPVTGTLAGVDPDGRGLKATEPYGIQGVTPSSGVATKVGNYGTLTVNTTTGAWTYTPNDILAINRLTAAETAQDAFQVTVKDIDQYSTQKTLTATITGINNTPVVAASIGNQTFAGLSSSSEIAQVTFAAATDDATPISFSLASTAITVAAAAGRTATVIADAVAVQINANASATYTASANAGIVTLTAKASGNLAAPTVVVTGPMATPTITTVQDGSTSWTYNLPSGIFFDADGDAPTSYSLDLREIAQVTFAAATDDSTAISFSLASTAITVAAAAGRTATVIADAVVAQINANASATYTASANAGVVTLTAKAAGNLAEPIVVITGPMATPTIITVQDGTTSLPSWLSFNTTTGQFGVVGGQTFGVTPVKGIAVTATIGGQTVTAAPFDLQLTNAAPKVANPIAFKTQNVVTEKSAVTFVGSNTNTAFTFDGTVVTVAPSRTGVQIADAFFARLVSGSTSSYNVSKSGNVLTFTAKTPGAITDLTINGTGAASATINVTQGADATATPTPATTEVTTVTFSNGTYAGATITLDGVTAVVPVVTAVEVATAVASITFPNYTTVRNSDVVTFTAKAVGEQVIVTATDFRPVTVATTTQGADAVGATPAVAEVTTATFSPVVGGTEITFGSIISTINPTRTGADIADAFFVRLAANATSNYNVTKSGAVLTFTAKTTGDIADLTISGTGAASASISITPGTSGGTPTSEVVTVTFSDGTYAGATITLDGVTAVVPLATGTEVATEVALKTFTGFTVTSSGAMVTLTKTAAGDTTDLTSSSFTISPASGASTVSITAADTDGWSYVIPANTFSDANGDALTYTAYTLNASNALVAISSTAGTATDGFTAGQLTFDASTRTLSGTGLAFNKPITIRATDTHGASADASFGLQVYNNTVTTSVTAGTTPTGVVFSDGAGAFTYTIPPSAFIVSGAAPTYVAQVNIAGTDREIPIGSPYAGHWLNFDRATGTFSGNPPASQTTPLAVSVTTGGITQSFSMAVIAPNDPLLVVTPIADQTVAARQSFSFDIDASGSPFTDGDGGAITYTAKADTDGDGDFSDESALPTSAGDYWLQFNTSTAAFSGTAPSNLQSLNVQVSATSADGSAATDTFTVQFTEPVANTEGTLTVNLSGSTLTAALTNDTISGTGSYQWQTSADDGATWINVPGTRGTAGSTLALTSNETSTKVRAIVNYTGIDGYVETVTSNASALIAPTSVPDVAGSVKIMGDLSPGSTLFAQVNDDNGIVGNITYAWYRNNDKVGDGTYNVSNDVRITDAAGNNVTGPTHTLTSADSFKYIRVVATYADQANPAATRTVETEAKNLAGTTFYVGLDATAPVAGNDTGAVTEKSGVLNSVAGTALPLTGTLLTNDTDVNTTDKFGVVDESKRALFKVVDLRLGGLEGDGTQGRKITTDVATSNYAYHLKGIYGWLEVDKAGGYKYYLDQNNASVQSLIAAGSTLADIFNYELSDGDGTDPLSDTATLTITISGANDLPTITGGIGRSSNAAVGSAAADTTAPVLSSSSVTGNKLVLKFSEGLASTDLPAASSFAVSVGGSAVAVSSVAASGSTVVLTLASAVTNGQVVTVSYTDATASNDTVALQDNNGNDVATITSASVVNKTPPASDTEAPAFVSAVLVADQLKLTFSELLNPANLPHEADFTISVAGSVLTWRDYRVVGVDEEVLTIQLNTAVTSPTTAVTVAYQDWSAGNDVNAIQDLANNDLPSLAAVTVTNQTVAVAAETFSESVSEDVATFLNTGGLVFADPDSNSITVKIEANNGARLVVPSALAYLTAEWGSDTSALILKGTASALNAALAGDSVQYITSPNGTQSGNTVTISASDDGGATFTPVVTTNIAIDGKNDSIKLDLDTTNATNGYGYVALFRPRGEAVKISNANSTIYDADGTEITSATIRIASGAVDNEFGTIFETLSSSLGTTETFTWEGLTVTGNGTTDIQVTGLSTHARYKELIDSISYINANPNAYGGDRQVTIRLTDKYAVESEQLESNSALLVLATANTAVQVGQRIFIGARNADDTAWVYTDTLATVATVVNSTHFIASNNLPLLTPSSAIRFVSTGSVASSVTNSSITLGSVNSSVFAGQKIYTTAGNEIGTVLSVSGSLVNISSTYGALDVGTTIIFETAATSSVTQTSANRTVDSITSTVSSSTIVLNTIDLSIAVGQVIYEGATERGVVASVSFSGAAGGSTTVTTKAAVSDVIAADTLVFKTFATNLTPTATTTIRNVWTTEVDLNGVLETGRDYTAGFAEGQTGGTPISASSASLDNQSVYVKTVVIALANATDGTSGGDENLFLNPAYVTALLGRGITYALSNNDHTLTLSAINQSAGVTAADMQLALRAVQYENLSQNPSVTPRIVNVTVTDITNTLTNSSLEGVAARTTINITPSNDAPTLAGDFAATVLEGGAYTLTTGDLSPSDIDNDITTLRYEVTSTSSSITVFRDTNGDGQVDAGEAIAVRNGSTAGQEFTQAEVIAGNIKVKQNGTDVSVIGLTETEAENLVNSAVYTNASANPSAGLRQVIFQNSTQMSSLGAASSAVTQTTTIDVTGTASDLFSGIDLSTPVTGDSYKTLSFKVTGVSDGINETITFGSGSTAHVVPLVLGSVVKDGAIYTVGAGSSATEFLLTVTKPFASIGLSLRDNGENGVLPVAASMNLTVTPVNDAPTFSATVAGGTFTEGGATRTLFSAAAVTDGDTSGAEQDITELKLTITGVRDGSAEKLVVDGQTISLTSGAVVGGSLGYAVTVAGSTATVTLTKTASASAWATLINGIAYQNTSNAPTNGNRVVTLTSLKDAGGTTNSGTDIKALNLSSTVTVQGIDTAPVVTSNGASVQNGGLLTITTASPVMLTATDVDSASDTLVYTLTAAATQGTLFLDKNGNSDVDEGETLVASAEFTQTDLDNGALKYFHTGNIGADAFSFRVKDATTTLSPITFDITVSAAGGVTGSGTSTANSTDGSDALFQQVAITTNTGESVKTLTFKVSGANDGSAEYLTINGQDVHLSAGSTTVGGVTYTVVDDGSGNFTVSVTSATGFTSTVANAIVNGASYGNDAVPPSTGERAISLASVTTTNGSSTFTTATNIGSVTTIAPTVDVFTAAQADAAIGTLTAGDDIKALTFTVSGVKDGANEVIKINGQEIALVAGSPVVIDGVTYQVTASTPAGTFIVTMTDATGPGLTALQAEAIVAGVTLSNSDSTPTDGARSVSLTSYSVGLASGTSITSSPTTSLASSTSSTTAVNGASVEPLSGAVITAPANVDVLTFSVSGVQDGSDEVLVIGGFSVPLVNGASLSNSNGTYAVTVTDGVATVVFTPAAALTAADAQTLVRGVDYLNNASPLTEGDRTVSLVSLSDVNSTTPIAQSATGSVSVAVVDGVYPAALPAALNLFDATEVAAAIPAPTSGNDFKSVSFNLTGIADGAQEVFQINGQDIPLVPGTVTVNGVTYTVTSSTAGSYTVTVTDTAQPGFSEAALQTMVSGATLTNTSSTATEGVRSVTLGTILQGATTSNTGTDPVALDTTAPTGSVVAPNTPVDAMAGDSVTVPTGSSVDSLTFTVTGVKDGAAEVLKFGAAPNIISVPLVNGIVASITPAGTYAVSVDSSGTATVVFTPTVELTEAQANSLITAATYTNTSNEPTGGVRSLDLTSMDVLTGSTVTTTPINSVGGDIAVQGATEGAPVFDASDVLPTADLVGKTVDSMTFTVTGVKDGVNEVLLVNGLAVPLVPGTVTSNSPAGSYLVTVDGSGTATVVFTPTTNLTEAQANALLEGMTYDNKATDVTGGARAVSLLSLVTTNPDGTSPATVTPTGVTGSLAVLVPSSEYAPLFNPTQVNAAIAAPVAGNDYKSISFDLTGIADGANEIFKVNGQNIPLVPGTMTVNGVTYTVTGSGTTYTVTVTDTVLPGFTESDLQTLVNGAVLINTDSTPTEGVRGVTIGTLQQGAAQVSTVTLGGAEPAATVVAPNTPVNALAGDAVTVASGSTVDSLTFTVTGVTDGNLEVLKFGVAPNITSVPLVAGGAITSTHPAGSYSVTVSGGTATVVFTPTTNLTGAETNALIAGATYTNTDTTPTEGVRTLSLTGMAVDNAGTVTQTSVSTVSGQIPVKASTTPLFNSAAVSTAIPAVTSGNDFKSVSFDLTGIKDGAAEVFRVNGQDIPLVAGTVTVSGVTYTVTGTGPDYQVTVTDTIQPGFTEAALQTLVGGATLTNTATSPSEGARGVTLGTVTQGITGTSAVNLTSTVSASVLAPDTPVLAMQGDSVVVDDATTSVDSLTFTVTGVKDGAAEVLKFGTTTVPLVNGTVTSTTPAGSFLVTVNDAGTATVVFRPTVNLTDAQTDSLIGAATYTNTSDTPTGGVRSLDLTSMDIQTTIGGAVTATAVTGVGGVIPVQGVIEGESVFNSSAVVPNLTNGKTVDSLTFGVTGVKDGSDEVLVINGVTVPLVNSSSISDGSGGTYSVTVDANGNAVVVYTPATNLTEAQANALLSGITYDNKASNVTDGARGFSVISMDTVDANNVTTTTATPGLDSVVSYGDVTNTAPVVSVNAGVTVAENQTVTLSASHLAVTDAQQNNLDLVFTVTDAVDRGQLFRDLNGNGLVNSGEALAVGSSFTQAELSGGSIKYRHDGSETRSDAFKFTVSDGVDTTAAQPFVISVTSVNDMPSGRPSIDGVIAQHAVLTASLTSMTDGDGLPSAASIQYTWKADGQTVGANAATYTLTADEIDKKITVSVAYTDLAGFSHTVTSLATAPVVNVNDAPTLPDSTLTVFEGGTITFNTSQIVAADQDGLTLDHQFKLVTAPTKGQIYLDANGNGMLDTGSESVLATNGTFTQDDLFNGRVRYQHLGSEDSDGFGLQAIDAGGLSSATAAFTVTRTAVNDAPTFQNLDGDVIAVPTAGVPVLLDRVATGLPAAVVADVDSTDLAGGQLRVAVNFNRNPAKDSLAIKQVGTGTGQISTDGADVKFGAITIGTFAGGSGANDLLITFNGSATKEAIAALVSAITFQNDESIPAESVRTVAFTLTDGDGGTSDVARVTVNLEANGAPIFLNANTSVAVFENNTQVGVFAATDPLRLVTTYSISSRDDSANADRTKFAINATTGVLTFVSAPDFETPTDAGSDNHYNVVVRATNANGYSEMPVEVAIIDQVTGTGEVAVDRTSPTYVMGTLSGNTLILYFSEATSLNAVNKPDRSAFTVTAGNTAVGIAALAVNATAKTVTLTLETALSSVTGLTVAYADPTAGNDTAALQDIAGNDAASFSVSNIVLMTGGGGSGGATGVTPVIENQVASLAISGAVAGDGNGDGIADANQSAVASVPMMITSLPESAPNNSAMTYITLVAASISGKVGASELTQITEITQRDMPANVPTAVDMPMGLIDFTATVAVAGGTSTFSLYVDSTLSFNGYWKQNSEGVWTNLASAAYGGSITEEGGKLRIDFTIKDGGEFDEDGLANGVIVDPGAIGTVPLSIVGMYAERPEGEGWF